MVELPRIAGFFIPLLKKWSMEYAGSGVAGIILAISCRVQESNCLATLGIFAFLGRKTRLFFSGMGIKDLDEQVKDFLSYLECGSLFIYPKFSSLSVYQLFMEVVADEIGWLDFYAAFSFGFNQERRSSKPHAIQAEKEIILHTVFTVCCDVFSGFAHFSSSTQQPLNADL
uniref:Uncharacterized protein n=1 Tax=Vitis vinifera TaxID=29760 RepID=F6HY87_VITVI